MNYRNRVSGLIVKLVRSNLANSTIECPGVNHEPVMHTLSTTKFYKVYTKVK